MRMLSGVVDQVIFFVAVDATDLKTRETGLTGFTVYRSRNGGTATVMTTPTVAELSAANMPGVYTLLLDEDMTIDAGDDSQEMCFHISQASMTPVTRTIELYRAKITAGNTLTVASGGALGALDTQAKADVNGEVVDALNVDTYAQPGQDNPPATASLARKISDLHKSWRNKKTNDGATTKLFADDTTTVDQKQSTSESAGTVTKGEWAIGP